jgi:asparagine synthase (glutamine-hydrolysing)
MCGFGGVINCHKSLKAADIAHIASGTTFRGPDSCGVRILDDSLAPIESGNNAIFFNRLAIIDLDPRSDQPFEDNDHLLVFNGEIYNYTELKLTLQKEGVVFRTTSDTEVLFFALRNWGTKALSKLNGMFAFFWLNKKEKTFVAGRDRLGIKPLYYSFNEGAFYFSSELHSIIRMLGRKPRISEQGIDMYLWMQFVPTPYSIYENVFKLPPGTYISTSSEKIKPSEPITYWDAYDFAANAENKPPEILEQILKDSVQRQLHADVPLGLFLSSGVDSSLLATIVNKYFAKEQDVNFFTVSFSEKEITDESADVLEFIKGFNNPHLKTHLLNVNAGYLQQHLTNLYEYYDEPFGDYASLLNWTISIKAREHVTVAISGDGADELFWGYSRYNKWQDMEKLSSSSFISTAVATAARFLPQSAIKARLKRIFTRDPVERHFDLFLMPDFRNYFSSPLTRYRLWALDNIDRVKERRDLPSILDIKTYLADAMLYKVDRSSMAASLEVRVPYLDNEVLEYALSLDLNKKSNQRYRNKAILKELLVSLAPHYDPNRPKKGFSFPLKKWLKEHWGELVRDSVNRNALISLGLEPDFFLSAINNFYDKDENNEVEVWYLLNLVLWKQSYDNMK